MEKIKLKKKKIILALCSMCLCLTLMGVAVYAAMSQSATITSSISVTTSGQVKAAVSVSKGTLAKTNNTTPYEGSAITTYVAMGETKNENTDSQSWNDESGCPFSVTGNAIAYGFKIDIANNAASGKASINAAVKFTDTSNAAYGTINANEVKVFIGDTDGGATEYDLTKTDAINFEGITANKSIYVIIGYTATGGLASCTNFSLKQFNISVELT